MTKKELEEREEYISIGKAAKILGMTVETIRGYTKRKNFSRFFQIFLDLEHII